MAAFALSALALLTSPRRCFQNAMREQKLPRYGSMMLIQSRSVCLSYVCRGVQCGQTVQDRPMVCTEIEYEGGLDILISTLYAIPNILKLGWERNLTFKTCNYSHVRPTLLVAEQYLRLKLQPGSKYSDFDTALDCCKFNTVTKQKKHGTASLCIRFIGFFSPSMKRCLFAQ